MDFSEKISTILKTNKLQLVTKEELSEFCGFNRDTIRKAIERGTELGERYTRIFMDKLHINPVWWDTGKGDIYLGNPTQEQKIIDNKEKAEFNESVYRTIVEGNTEYVLIPRSVLNEVQLISTAQLEKDKRIMEIVLQQNEKLIAKLVSSDPQLPNIKEAKKNP